MVCSNVCRGLLWVVWRILQTSMRAGGGLLEITWRILLTLLFASFAVSLNSLFGSFWGRVS